MFKKKILLDLDGLLNEYGKEKFDENFIPEIKTCAADFIKELSEIAELYLFTTRNLLFSSKWLLENRLDKYFKNVINVKIPSYFILVIMIKKFVV